MKKIVSLTSVLFFISPSLLGQTSSAIDIVIKHAQDEAKNAETTYQNVIHNYQMYEKNIPLFKERLKKAEDTHRKASHALVGYDKYLASLKEFMEKSESELSTFQRIASRKKSFLNCLDEGFYRNGFPDVKTCRSNYRASFTTEENIFLREIEKSLIAPKTVLEQQIITSEKEIKITAESLERFISHQKYSDDRMLAETSKKDKESKDKAIKELEVLKSKSELYTCSPRLKTIDLEEEYISEGSKVKGPFFNVKRDNQDGLGTCYANTAKNFLVALSGGKMVGSFLDMSLQFKLAEEEYTKSGLDGGNSCGVLRHIKKRGYCEQKHAPTETGEPNELLSALLNPKFNTMQAQAKVIESLKNFFDSKKNLSKDDKGIQDLFLKSPKKIIEIIKANPDVVLPLPIVNNTPGNNKNLRNIFIEYAGQPTEFNLQELEKDIAAHDKKFKAKYIQLAMDNASLDRIISEYKDNFLEILKKHTAERAYDKLIEDFRHNSSFIYNEDNRKKLYESAQFMHSLTQKDGMSFEKFAASCLSLLNNGINLVENLKPLINDFRVFDIPTDKLFSETGFKEDADLMYLTIAPACMNEENRKKVDIDFSCSDSRESMTKFRVSFNEDTKAMEEGLRARVVNNLLKGLPVGNSHEQPGGNHINTIVGVRYNQATKGCEYKIRESQNGRSEWESESPIARKIYSLTEIGK